MKVIDFAQRQKKSLLDQISCAGAFFDVETSPLITNYKGMEIIVPDKQAIINNDTSEVIGITGKNYKLVKNEEIFTSFNDAISKSTINVTDAKAKVMFSNGGAKTMIEYTFPQHVISVGNNDETMLRIVAKNSYDGTWSFSTQTGGYRLVCMNGQVMGMDVSCYSNKHCSTLDVDIAAKKLTTAIDTFEYQGEQWNEWKEIKINDEQAYMLIAYMLCQKNEIKNGLYHQDALKKTSIKNIWLIWKKDSKLLGNNKWTLYNTMTEWSSHTKSKEKNKAATIARREESVRNVISSEIFKIAA